MSTTDVSGSPDQEGLIPALEVSVLAAIEGSVADVSALDWAADLAERARMRLRIMHVVENVPQPMMPHESYADAPALRGGRNRDARAMLDKASAYVKERQPDLDVTPIFKLGAPAAVLIEQSSIARLLVIGATLQSRLKRLLLGSVSLACIQHATCPVVVVPRGHKTRPLTRIVVGVDGSPASAKATSFALSIAEATGASVTCVIGWNIEFVDGIMVTDHDSPAWKATQIRFEDLVHTIVDPLAAQHPDVSVTVDVRPVWPAYAVLESADEVDADLVVVGSRGLGGFLGLLLGSVGKRVIEHANRPVAIVR